MMVLVGAIPTHVGWECICGGQLRCPRPGPALEVVALAMGLMQLKYGFVRPLDGYWGADANINGSWNGMFADLKRGRIDITVPYFSVANARIAEFAYIEFEVLPLKVAFLFKRSTLKYSARFTWWRALTPRLWVALCVVCILTTIVFGNKGSLVGLHTLCLTIAIYQQLLGVFLLSELIVTQKAPFDSIQSAAGTLRRGQFRLIANGMSGARSIMNQPEYEGLRDALREGNSVIWTRSESESLDTFRRQRLGVVFGSEDYCINYEKLGFTVICATLTDRLGQLVYYTTYLRSGIPKSFKHDLGKAFLQLKQLGIIPAIATRYFKPSQYLQASGRAETLRPIALLDLKHLFVASATAIVGCCVWAASEGRFGHRSGGPV